MVTALNTITLTLDGDNYVHVCKKNKTDINNIKTNHSSS